MAATEKEGSSLGPLWQAALALPILVVPARAGAAEVGEMGFTLLGYKERGLMKVTEPIHWGHARIGENWEVAASAAVDIITGASPQLVTNVTGKPVQTISGASISDRRLTSDVKVGRHFGDFTLSASHTSSREHDYLSTAWGLEGRLDLNDRLTTVTAGYGRSDDLVRSHDDPTLNQPRTTNEYLIGISQVLSPVAVIQSTLTTARGHGWYNDPYKFTLTFFPGGGVPAFLPDLRPPERDTWAWTTRYRHHFPSARSTLQAEYRFYHDDWGIDAHTLEVAVSHALNERWSLRPALRYYTQSAADFYSPTIPRPTPAIQSSDQRLGAFGGLSPSLRATVRLDNGFRVEGTAGYVHNARTLHFGGSGSEAFQALRAVYGILSVSREF
ncbi:MAG TPA: porin [Usitatibacter sp.]|nr:porin [Usitatibacter sp.]